MSDGKESLPGEGNVGWSHPDRLVLILVPVQGRPADPQEGGRVEPESVVRVFRPPLRPLVQKRI
jgi:hypothetical protein